MKTWEALHPFARPDLPGCPVPLVDRALCDAAREFCTATLAWTEWADPFTADGTTNRFEFDLPTGAELVRATRVRVGSDDDYGVLSSRSLPPGWQNGETPHDPQDALVHIDMLQYLLYPLPPGGTEVVIEMALKPAISSSGVFDSVVDKYAEALASGAKARLMAQPKKAWTDLGTASMHRTLFERAMQLASSESFRQLGLADRHTKPWGELGARSALGVRGALWR